jgi:hypothetical protein
MVLPVGLSSGRVELAKNVPKRHLRGFEPPKVELNAVGRLKCAQSLLDLVASLACGRNIRQVEYVTSPSGMDQNQQTGHLTN